MLQPEGLERMRPFPQKQPTSKTYNLQKFLTYVGHQEKNYTISHSAIGTS